MEAKNKRRSAADQVRAYKKAQTRKSLFNLGSKRNMSAKPLHDIQLLLPTYYIRPDVKDPDQLT